jgi:hypothetical protein
MPDAGEQRESHWLCQCSSGATGFASALRVPLALPVLCGRSANEGYFSGLVRSCQGNR